VLLSRPTNGEHVKRVTQQRDITTYAVTVYLFTCPLYLVWRLFQVTRVQSVVDTSSVLYTRRTSFNHFVVGWASVMAADVSGGRGEADARRGGGQVVRTWIACPEGGGLQRVADRQGVDKGESWRLKTLRERKVTATSVVARSRLKISYTRCSFLECRHIALLFYASDFLAGFRPVAVVWRLLC